MDLEELTKHQTILLTLLVSFVTSIATGIVTVSLMSQAPVGVTKVVNQIVEHTIEKVVPSTQSAAVTTTEKTVVVKDDDLTAQSIAKVQKSIVRIVAAGKDDLLARGVIVDASGTVLTDRAALETSGYTSFEAILSSGTRVPAVLRTQTGTTTSLAAVDLTLGTSTTLSPATIGDVSKLALGQSAIRIGGMGTDVVAVGVVAALPATTGATKGLVEASTPSATPGALLLTLFGEVVGIATTESLSVGADFYTVASVPIKPTTETPVTSGHTAM